MSDTGDDEVAGGANVVPSELDEITHAELRMLYEDSSNSLRFARERQWKLVGGVLLLFAIIIALPEIFSLTSFAGRGLAMASILISASSIYMLIIYQVSQNADLKRQRTISEQFSNIFAELGGERVKREAKSHGLIIQLLMILAIVVSNAVVLAVLAPLYQ